MFLIALEGLDKSGKYTQSNLLAKRLSEDGCKVIQSEFHRYDQPTGKLIIDWLTGRWNTDQYTIELVMAADKQAQQNWFTELESEGCDVLILDRYLLSQIAYGKANGMDYNWILQLQKNMRKSNLEIVIDIPAEVSMNRKGKHNNGNNDKYESNLAMLKEARENFIIFKNGITATEKYIVDGLMTIEELHEDIYRIAVDNGGFNGK